MTSDVQKKIDEIQANMAEMPMHIYILIWAVTDMSSRMTNNSKDPRFCEISYPFSPVPLFDKSEAANLESVWRKNIEGKDLFPDEPQSRQKGGKLPSIAQMKGKAAAFGQTLNFAFKAFEPRKVSPDYLYDYTTDIFDSMDSALTHASGDYGIVALESTMPDPRLIIPTVPPIPVPVPVRSIFPVINAIMETIRITVGVFRLTDPLGVMDPFGVAKNTQIIMTILMILLDISRGNLYHAIFTSMGLFGTTPLFVGIALKIVRDAIMLVSPDIRKDIRDLLFKSSKSFVLGFHIWLFTTMSPDFVKAPLATLLNTVSMQLEAINLQLDSAEATANMGPAGVLATIKLPRIPSDKIPDINNLYALREAIREPAIYCDPKISALMEELRDIPPYALFFDLALIPKPTNPEYNKMCAPLKGASLQDSLSQMVAPQIIPMGSDTPLPMVPLQNPVVASDIPAVAVPVSASISETIPEAPSTTAAAATEPSTTAATVPSTTAATEPSTTAATAASSLLGNPAAALQSTATQAASNALAKSPAGQLLGANPLAALSDPKAALQSAATQAASNALAKSPAGQLLGSNPLGALSNPQTALSKGILGAVAKKK